jgi:hypothetical protein
LPKTLDSGQSDSPAENQRFCWVFEGHFGECFLPPEFLRSLLVAGMIHLVESTFTFLRSYNLEAAISSGQE